MQRGRAQCGQLGELLDSDRFGEVLADEADDTGDTGQATVGQTDLPYKVSLATIARKRAPIGTTFTVTLSRAALLRLTFARREAGRRTGKRCVAPGSARNGALCTRWVAAGRLALAGHSGTDKIHFEGRLAHGHLRPGTYRLTISARAGAKRVTARPVTSTIVPG